MTSCTRCEGTGFLNTQQLPDNIDGYDVSCVEKWIEKNKDHDVQICDCCGDSEGWYGEPGAHYGSDDSPGVGGVYSYNGGLCECH